MCSECNVFLTKQINFHAEVLYHHYQMIPILHELGNFTYSSTYSYLKDWIFKNLNSGLHFVLHQTAITE